MNPTAEQQAALLGLTYWEVLVLDRIDHFGEMYAGSGTSALFDAGWALERRGLLEANYDLGVAYLKMTSAGLEVLAKYRAAPQTPAHGREEGV